MILSEHIGTSRFVDYRATINGFSEKVIDTFYSTSPDCIILECTKFIPPVLPEDYELPKAYGHRRDSTDEPQSKKRKVVAEVANGETTEPGVMKGLGGAHKDSAPSTKASSLAPQANGHHSVHHDVLAQPKDTFSLAPPTPTPTSETKIVLDEGGRPGSRVPHIPFTFGRMSEIGVTGKEQSRCMREQRG